MALNNLSEQTRMWTHKKYRCST